MRQRDLERPAPRGQTTPSGRLVKGLHHIGVQRRRDSNFSQTVWTRHLSLSCDRLAHTLVHTFPHVNTGLTVAVRMPAVLPSTLSQEGDVMAEGSASCRYRPRVRAASMNHWTISGLDMGGISQLVDRM